MWHTDKTNYYQRVLDVGLGTNNAFRVTKKSLWGQHKVVIEDGIVKINGVGDAAVHDDACP